MATPTLKQLEEALPVGTIGFCLVCGTEADGVEPDARHYDCLECEQPQVYGAAEILLMGLFSA